MNILIASLLLLSSINGIASLKCAEDDLECHEKLKYTKEENASEKWGKYLKLIEKAVNEYEECSSTNCSCYSKQIEIDLKPWKATGITKDIFKKASEIDRLSHYQIINKKLYRDKDEMFPAR